MGEGTVIVAASPISADRILRTFARGVAFLLLFFGCLIIFALPGKVLATTDGVHEGVASCAGSTCHGRQAPTGAIVRDRKSVV